MAEQKQTVSLNASLQSLIKMMGDPEVKIPITYAMPLGDLAKMAIGILNGDLIIKTPAEMAELVPKSTPASKK